MTTGAASMTTTTIIPEGRIAENICSDRVLLSLTDAVEKIFSG
jgi:hypothetical protein